MTDSLIFDGSDYVPPRDNPRLSKQYLRVFDLMKDGSSRTLKLIATTTGDPEASVSAQLRHMRKPRFGGHTIDKQYVGNGLYQYRLLVRPAWNPIEPTQKKAHCSTCHCFQEPVPQEQLGMQL